jgi:hypothetical protein
MPPDIQDQYNSFAGDDFVQVTTYVGQPVSPEDQASIAQFKERLEAENQKRQAEAEARTHRDEQRATERATRTEERTRRAEQREQRAREKTERDAEKARARGEGSAASAWEPVSRQPGDRPFPPGPWSGVSGSTSGTSFQQYPVVNQVVNQTIYGSVKNYGSPNADTSTRFDSMAGGNTASLV